MKTLLINPPWYFTEGKKSPTFSLGIAYIASILRNDGHDVFLIDADAEGIKWNLLENKIKKLNPDFVGITSTTVMFESALKTAKIVKKNNKKTFVCMGGSHVTALPEETLKNKYVDCVVRGEGEETIKSLIHSLENKKTLDNVLGISFKEGKKIKHNDNREPISDLDSLPFPARDLLPMKQIDRTLWGHPAGHILSSRGCPNMCVFCASHLIFGKKARFRSSKNIVDEIEELVKKYNIKRFAFSDDTFTLDSKRVSEICSDIIKRKLDVNWVCQARVSTINKKMLIEMKNAGCVEIDFGVESGDPQVLQCMKKGITHDQIKRAIKISKEVGIKTLAYYIIGTPFDTKESTKKTISFAKKLGANHSYFNILVPYPGTEIYNNAKKTKSIKFNKWSDFHQAKSIIKMNLSNKYIELIQKKAKRDLFIIEMKQKMFSGDIYGFYKDFLRGLIYIKNKVGL